MAEVPRILFGAGFTLAAAYALGGLLLRRLPVPRPVVLATGAACLSLLVFLALAAGIAGTPAFAASGTVAVGGYALLRRRAARADLAGPPAAVSLALAAYGALYFVHALAPEIQPDGMGYHLGLVAEYARLGSFPDRVGFYEMVPQGMEMLFLFAFAFGRHSAAKLVHLGLVFATLPLIVELGRRLRIAPALAWGAAALYLCAPVVGVTGTSSYNDPALVFYCLTALWGVLAWRQEGKYGYLLPAGIAAGFCYAVKMPGLVVLPLAVAWVAAARRLRPVVLLLLPGLAMAAPWMVRNAVAAGNPLAPLFNRWFPNPYFHLPMEEVLARNLSSYGGVTLARAPWELAAGGQLQGTLGLAFLAAPVGLLALRRREGRLLWAAAVLLALPWLANMGTRFLLPAVPLVALALAAALPRAALWAAVLFQALACWPAVLDRYAPPHAWRLHGFPLRAALRIQPEAEYLAAFEEYRTAIMARDATGPAERIFSLISPAKAYLEREVLEYWHSAEADRLLDTLKVAGMYTRDPFYDLRADWPPGRCEAYASAY